MCNNTSTYSTLWISFCYTILPLASFPLCLLPLHVNYPFNLLGNPLFGDRGANVTRPWLVIDCPPLALYPPPPLPTVPTVHVTCFQRRHHNICYTVWYINTSWFLVPVAGLQKHQVQLVRTASAAISLHQHKRISFYTWNADIGKLQIGVFLLQLQLHPPPLETRESVLLTIRNKDPNSDRVNRFWLVREFWKADSGV